MRLTFITILALLIGGSSLLSGCANMHSERGVENRWRGSDAPKFTSGDTKQADVLEALGPPSQVIALGSGTVFYYLLEEGSGKGLILLVYNDVRAQVKYDRAIFFFDEQGVLTDYAYSKQDAPSP